MTENPVPTWTPWGELTCIPNIDRTQIASLARPAANDNYPRIVALTGPAGSGKSSAANYLIERHGYQRVKLAGPLKDMMRVLGLNDRHIEGDLKEVPCDLLSGRTPRHAMQTIGTQWGRDCMDEDFWVRIWVERANQVARAGGRVVVDDCRFPNEAFAIRKLGGMIIRIDGRGGISSGHSSESGCGISDAIINNVGGLADLFSDVEEEVLRWAA